MRHQLTTRFTLAVTVVTLLASLLWVALASRVTG